MARGITGILFTDEDLETGQIKEYPSLKNCRVYGVMANSLFSYIEAGIVEESRNRSEILKEKGYKNSGIKWIYGRVNSLEKIGIEWLHWFNDTNQNNKKDPGEQNIENEPLIKISGSDLYGVGGAYNRADSISLWFDKDEKFLPALYWVEPFLVHPELHFGAAPKGMFMMPAQHPGPYEVIISGNHTVHRGAFSRILASTVEQAKYTYLYYGENVDFLILTLHIPEGEKLSVEIWDESSDKTLYSTTATVTKNKPAQEGEESDELQDYLEQFKGFAEVTVPLDISKMPEDQKKKEARVYKVQISYLPSDFSLVNEMGAVAAAFEISSAVISSRIRKELANKPRAQSVTGYIQIMYEDTEAYINTRNAPVNQVVERETPVLLTPKGEPCHYTQIKAQRYKDEGFTKKDGEEAIIFDETKMILPKSQPTIEVIAGDAKPAFLKLMADLHTNEACRPGTHTRGGKSVFYFHKEASAEQQNLTVVQIKEKEIDLTLPYIYIKDKKVANMVSTFPFNYFWLTDKDVQPYVVMIKTCRYTNDVLINVYPDMEWDFNFFYNTKDPVWYGEKEPNYNLYNLDDKNSVNKNISLKDVRNWGDVKAVADLKNEERNRKRQNTSTQTRMTTMANRNLGDKLTNFGLTIKAKYNGKITEELSWNFAEKYRSTTKILKSIYDTAEKITGAVQARKAAKEVGTKTPSLLGRLNAMSLSLQAPAPSAGINWKYATTKNRVGLQLEGYVKCTPLIGGNLKIDLLALGEKIPVYGKLITALDIATWLASKLSMGVLEINYRIDLIFYANLAIDKAYVNWNGTRPKGKQFDTDMKISGTFGGKLEISTEVKAQSKYMTKQGVEVSFEAGVKADCYFKITADPNFNKENKVNWTTEFSGLIVEFYYKLSLKSTSKNKPPKTLSPIKLIPSYTGKTTMKF